MTLPCHTGAVRGEPQESRFQIGQMDDASEAMEAIFSRIHVEQVLVAQGLSLDTEARPGTEAGVPGPTVPGGAGAVAGAGSGAGAGGDTAEGGGGGKVEEGSAGGDAVIARALGAFAPEEQACTPTCVAHEVFGCVVGRLTACVAPTLAMAGTLTLTCDRGGTCACAFLLGAGTSISTNT